MERDTNELIASTYGKDGVKNFAEGSEVLYLDPNKKRTESWMQGVGLQLPSDTISFGSIGSITYPDGKIKIDGVPYMEYMQTGRKNTDSRKAEDGAKYSLMEYSEHQKENWKNSKRIIIYESEKQFRDFIASSKKG